MINTGIEQLRLYSLYAPAEHPDGTVHETKADADAAERAPMRPEPPMRPELSKGRRWT